MFEIIENTEEARDEYGHCYGSHDLTITVEDMNALLCGKTLAWDDGEYTTFITLDKEDGDN